MKQKKTLCIAGSMILPIAVGEPAVILEQNRGYRQTTAVVDAKPAVCAMFPLGRAVRIDKDDAEKEELPPLKVEYIITDIDCGDNSETHTVKDWLESFGIPLKDEYFIKWQTTITLLSPRIQKLEKAFDEKTVNRIIDFLYIKLYLDYDMNREFYPQFVENAEICVKVIKEILELQTEVAV